ncbi:MAG TPA: CAP domain-containing protein [Candidatus Paceibacterota bacterium]|nr:CAP domain-containing protein [Candidatus Paceibacterota bacterium]
MLKSILSISIMAAIGLLILAILLPTQTNQMAQRVLGEMTSIGNSSLISNPVATLSNKLASAVNTQTLKSSSADNSVLSAADIIDATNQERLDDGLPPLKTNNELAASAKLKVEDMITNQYFDHTSPSGKTVADLGQQVGYDYVVMGENLALGDFTSAHDLLQAWMKSPGHRANILNDTYQDIGVYAAQGMYQGHMVWFAVQHFGTERTACPPLDTTLKTTIDTLNATLKNEEAQIESLRAQIEDPNHPTGSTYSTLISKFNSMVSMYNSQLVTSQSQISSYNKQVVAFNKCLSQYQTSKSKE